MIKKFRNAKIKTKLGIVAFLIAVFFIIVGISSVQALSATSSQYEIAYDSYGEALGQLCSADADFQTARADLISVFTDSITTKEAEKLIAEDWQEMAHHMEEYTSCIIDDDIKNANQELMNEITEYYNVVTEILALVEDEDFAKAEKILNTDAKELEQTIDGHFRNIEAISEEKGNSVRAEAAKLGNTYIFIIAAVFVVFILLMFGMVDIIIKSISAPIRKLVDVAERISIGDVDVEVKRESKDEIGDLAEMFEAMVNNIKYQSKIVAELANANYTVDVIQKSENDVMGKNLKILVEKNNELFGHTKDAVYQVSAGANQVALASQSIAQGSTNQASAIQQITASINSIADGTKVNAEDASTARTLVVNTKDNAIHGNAQMSEMIDAMKEINESSENISKIIKVIDDIAFQTNILALNAAVEAARAGAHGKGFAVVAEEVRNLAAKSATAASETAEMIEDSIHKVENGSKLAESTATALKDIEENVENIVDIVTKIAEASNDQATAVAQIDQALTQVSQVVQDNSATSEECASASDELSSQAVKLREMVEDIKTKGVISNTDNLGFGNSSYSAPKLDSYQNDYSDSDFDNSIYGDNEPFIKLDGGYDKY